MTHPASPRGSLRGSLRASPQDAGDARHGEIFTDLLKHPGCRIERIVSHGQVTPVDQPYQQRHDEWVMLVTGRARVRVEDQETTLVPGDYLFIPAGARHWVSFTATDQATVWLAIHLGEPGL